MSEETLICNHCYHTAHCGQSCQDESCDNCTECACDYCQSQTEDEQKGYN